VGGGLHNMYAQGRSWDINKIHKELILKMEYMNQLIVRCMRNHYCDWGTGLGHENIWVWVWAEDHVGAT